MLHARLLATLPFAALLSASPALGQSTWYVDVAGTPPGTGTLADPYTSLQYAVDRPSTVQFDTLIVAPGTYVESVDTREKGLVIRSSGGPLATVLQPGGPGTVFHSLTFDVLEGFTIAGHVSPAGPGPVTAALVLGGTTIRDCIVRDNARAVFVIYDGEIRDSTIAGNASGIQLNNFGSVLHIAGSIVAGNDHDLLAGAATKVTADHSAGFVTAIYPEHELENLGTGNLLGDPRMWDVASGELRLAPGSPCIDAGDPSAPLDPDGTRKDIGALAFLASYAPAPTAYCTAKVNSLGCVPAIGATGAASASGSPFSVTCSNVLSHKSGLLFYGFGPKGTPYQGGYLCVTSPVRRTALTNSGGTPGVDDCSGVHSYDFDARILSGADPALAAGEMVYAQWWSRDPGAAFNNVRSDALRFGIAP